MSGISVLLYPIAQSDDDSMQSLAVIRELLIRYCGDPPHRDLEVAASLFSIHEVRLALLLKGGLSHTTATS
jgi:hypothetical protein